MPQQTEAETVASGGRDPVTTHVGRQIRSRREALGLDRRALARRIGVAPRAMDGFEAGTRRVGPVHLMVLSNALEVSVDYFFEGLPQVDAVASVAETHGNTTEYQDFVEAYFNISDRHTRRDFFKLVRAVSETY